MARKQPPKDPAAIKREIDHLSTLDLVSLRVAWRSMFKRAGKGLSRDLLPRTMAWEIQERAFDGYDSATAKALACYAKESCDAAQLKRHLQAGTVLVREHRGTGHPVTVVPGGFVWRDQSYSNLSKIARAIAGVNWNGARFFGLRHSQPELCHEPQVAA